MSIPEASIIKKNESVVIAQDFVDLGNKSQSLK